MKDAKNDIQAPQAHRNSQSVPQLCRSSTTCESKRTLSRSVCLSVWESIHSIHCDLHRYNISVQPPNNSIISSISAQPSLIQSAASHPIQLWKFAGLNFADTIQSPLPLVVIVVVIVSLVYKYWPKYYLPCPCLCRCVCLLHNSDTDQTEPRLESSSVNMAMLCPQKSIAVDCTKCKQ